MKFGKVIRLESNLEWNTKWTDYYVDYKALKQLLNRHVNADGTVSGTGELLKSFRMQWKREVLKIDSFLKREAAALNAKVEKSATKPEALGRRLVDFKRLRQFCDVNHEALRKILKKVAKRAPDDQTELHQVLESARPKVETMFDKHTSVLDELEAKVESMSALAPVKAEHDESVAEAQLTEAEVEEDDIPVLNELLIEPLPPGKITRLKVALQLNELGENIVVHVIVAKGKFDGPTLGITSALHGNELNGIPLIFRLFREIDVDQLVGTVVAIPVLNPPGFQRRQRGFMDGQDLNRLFPGKADGNCGQAFSHNVLNKIVCHFNYHIDLHTASHGRVNSLYVRANMLNPTTYSMALLQNAEIIVHNTAPDGSLRSAAMDLNIPSITVEIGDPLQFHNQYIMSALYGVENVLTWLRMHSFDEERPAPPMMARPTSPRPSSPRKAPGPPEQGSKTTICARSKWMFAKHGGVLRVRPGVNTWVEKGQVIAQVQNLYGDILHTYRAPADAIVVGKSTNPICATGDRIVHLGYVEDSYPAKVDDGH